MAFFRVGSGGTAPFELVGDSGKITLGNGASTSKNITLTESGLTIDQLLVFPYRVTGHSTSYDGEERNLYDGVTLNSISGTTLSTTVSHQRYSDHAVKGFVYLHVYKVKN